MTEEKRHRANVLAHEISEHKQYVSAFEARHRVPEKGSFRIENMCSTPEWLIDIWAPIIRKANEDFKDAIDLKITELQKEFDKL